ncbi:MAG: hypothetical protein QXS93_00145 [Candidatus Micrarchaeia archaeon]
MRTYRINVGISESKRGFIISLEPALSLLMLLLLIVLLTNHYYLQFQDYSSTIKTMQSTDLWLVNDSIYYYNQTQLKPQYEWLKKEL